MDKHDAFKQRVTNADDEDLAGLAAMRENFSSRKLAMIDAEIQRRGMVAATVAREEDVEIAGAREDAATHGVGYLQVGANGEIRHVSVKDILAAHKPPRKKTTKKSD